MMQALRKKTRYVLFIALAGFALLIFFQWGLDITGVRNEQEKNIAKIDGVPVSYVEYIRFIQLKEREHRGISHDEIWDLMVDEIVWNNLMKKEKIVVTDEEVWAVIRNNPPREIYESEYMRDENGEFDFNKYYTLLKAPQSRTWLLEYEYNIRRQIPREKLRSLVSSFGWVSPFEDSVIIARQTVEYDISYLNLPLYRARSLLEVSEQEMMDYYNNYPEEFVNPELKILKYVFFEKKPSSYDTLEARERIEDFIARVEDGGDFLELANEISDDTIIVKDFENEAELKPYLIDVYKNLKNGEMSDIVQTSQGFEVIKKVSRGLIHRVAVNIVVSTTTRGEIYDKIMSFKGTAQEWGFDSAASDFDIKLRRTYPLSSDNVTFPVRNIDGLAKFMAEAKIDEIGGPYGSFGGYYLFTLDSVIPETHPTFEDIKPKIKVRIERERLKEVIEQSLDEYYGQLMAGKSMEEIVSEDTIVAFHKSEGVTLEKVQMTLGAEFAGMLATLESGQLSLPLVMDWAGYIIRCDAKIVNPFDSTMVTSLQMKRQGRLEALTSDIFIPKEVEDNRDLFFE